MKTVLVAGGAGGVGEGIVRALLEGGHRTIVPSRTAAKLAVLRERLGPLPPDRYVELVDDLGSPYGAARVRDRIRDRIGPLDAAIASLGGWWEGARLLDVEPDEWERVMHEMLTTHFIFVRTFVPMLIAQGHGRYIGLGGGAAYFPVRGSSLVSIAAAAQLMMTRALRAELRDAPIEIVELVVNGPVNTRDSQANAAPNWITADDIGAVVRDLVERGEASGPNLSREGPLVRMDPLR